MCPALVRLAGRDDEVSHNFALLRPEEARSYEAPCSIHSDETEPTATLIDIGLPKRGRNGRPGFHSIGTFFCRAALWRRVLEIAPVTP